MIQAKEIMNRETPRVAFDISVVDAIEYLKRRPEGFAIVQAAPDRLQGVLTEAGMMRAFLRFQATQDKESLIFFRDVFEPAQLVHEDELFPEIMKKILTAVGSRVFVINASGATVGYITSKDILPYFSRSAAAKNNDSKPLESLRSDLYLYETFFAKSPFMMHSIGRDGKIQMANEVLHAVLKYDYGELIGKTIFDLYPKSAHAQAAEGLERIISQGYHQVVRGTMLSKSATEIDVELVSRALLNQKGEAIGTMTVSRPFDMKYLLSCLPGL